VLSHKRGWTVAKKWMGNVSNHTFKLYKSGSVPHKSPSEEIYPKNNAVINTSKINDVQEVFQYIGVENMSYYQMLKSWPVVRQKQEIVMIQYMMLSHDILGIILTHKHSLAHKLIVTSFHYFML
jgi:hypothetical protein